MNFLLRPPFLFEPNTLVTAMTKSFQKASLPLNYRVEVLQCLGGEVAYSYEMNATKEKTIIPCAGRFFTQRMLHNSSTIFGRKTHII